jgi:cytochrome c553
MKKYTLIITLLLFVFGCAKKIAPAATGSSATPAINDGKVIGTNTPLTPLQTTTDAPTATTTPATKDMGTKTTDPTKPTAAATPEMQGQSTYNAKCGKCHGLKPTTDYTAERWAGIVAVMAPKAKLDATEKDNVMAYVKANAKK